MQASPSSSLTVSAAALTACSLREHDNIWIACNQANEVLVLERKQGRAIAKFGDFGGIDKDGAPIGFLWSNTLCFHGEDVLVTNLSF
jgi:hypothetical protein